MTLSTELQKRTSAAHQNSSHAPKLKSHSKIQVHTKLALVATANCFESQVARWIATFTLNCELHNGLQSTTQDHNFPGLQWPSWQCSCPFLCYWVHSDMCGIVLIVDCDWKSLSLCWISAVGKTIEALQRGCTGSTAKPKLSEPKPAVQDCWLLVGWIKRG